MQGVGFVHRDRCATCQHEALPVCQAIDYNLSILSDLREDRAKIVDAVKALKCLNLILVASQCSVSYKQRVVTLMIGLYPSLLKGKLRRAAYKCFIALHHSQILANNGTEKQLACDCSILKFSSDEIYKRYKFYVQLLEGTLTVQMSFMVDFEAAISPLHLFKKLALRQFAIHYYSIKPLEDNFLQIFGKHIICLDLRMQKLKLNDVILRNVLSKCSQLVSLFVQSVKCTRNGFIHLRCLSQLRVLNLAGCAQIDPATLDLPAGLKRFVKPDGTVETWDK